MQSLSIVKNQKRTFLELHNEAMSAAQDLKMHYLNLFEILLAVEADQIYQQFEVTSLYMYCTELLELSPSISNDFINVVRKSLEIPELAAAVRSRKLTISKARKICPVITTTDHKQWIELAETCSTRTVEKVVAQANPRSAIHEALKYISEEVLEFKLAVSEEWHKLLTETKDQLSQKYRRAISSEEALFILMKENFSKNDPVEKAKRALVERTKRSEVSGTEKSDHHRDTQLSNGSAGITRAKSRYRRGAVEHIVNLRDQNQCTYIDLRGKRCDEKRWLHKHHIREFANGGDHTPENLETLCSGHHKIRHQQS